MDADEREIYYYLKSWKNEFIAARDICRRAGGKHRYRQSPEWAKPVLTRMEERGILESDNAGYYRLKPPPEKNKKRHWVSPQVAKILQQSGKDFSASIRIDDDVDAYYEGL
ncbi:MAG: hypothetical protein IH623_24670 [Verrucomicrobia bacterium]|nr:hypothetical protein [Verrucomicrobiota bacterium]